LWLLTLKDLGVVPTTIIHNAIQIKEYFQRTSVEVRSELVGNLETRSWPFASRWFWNDWSEQPALIEDEIFEVRHALDSRETLSSNCSKESDSINNINIIFKSFDTPCKSTQVCEVERN
jgi:hypothetical protein